MSTTIEKKKEVRFRKNLANTTVHHSILEFQNKSENRGHFVILCTLAFFIGLSIYTGNPLMKELIIASSIIGLVLINKIIQQRQTSESFINNHFSKINKN